MSLLNRGHRGQLRERYIGEGKLRELLSEASTKEKSGDLLGAGEVWQQALRHIDYRKKDALQKECYINNRIHYCKVWGLRLKPLN